MPLGRSAAHKICVSALELAKTLVSKEALKSFQRGVGFLIRWQPNCHLCSTCTCILSFALCLEDTRVHW